jgi:outer membrane cobalamin receptor
LQPEQSEDRFAEAWIERGTLQKSALHIRVGDQSVERLIAWRASFDGRWKPTNIPRARIQTLGLEFEQAVLGEHLQLQGGAEWTEARDAGSDRNTANKYLTFRAPRVFRGSLESRWGHFSGSLGYRYVDARPATDSNTKWLSAYRLVDAMLEYEIGIDRTRVACRAGLSNGLNEDYRIVRHAPLPLREFLVGIRFTPKGTEK